MGCSDELESLLVAKGRLVEAMRTGKSITELETRGRRVKFTDPLKQLDALNSEIDRINSARSRRRSGPARNRVRLMKG